MNRKLKKAMDIADIWIKTAIDGHFITERTEIHLELRVTENYTVMINDPKDFLKTPIVEILPKTSKMSEITQEEKAEIIRHETNLFKELMIMKSIQEKSINLDSKNRKKLSVYVADKLK